MKRKIETNYFNPGMASLNEAINLYNRHRSVEFVPTNVQERYDFAREKAEAFNCDISGLPKSLGIKGIIEEAENHIDKHNMTDFFSSLIMPEDLVPEKYELEWRGVA